MKFPTNPTLSFIEDSYTAQFVSNKLLLLLQAKLSNSQAGGKPACMHVLIFFNLGNIWKNLLLIAKSKKS